MLHHQIRPYRRRPKANIRTNNTITTNRNVTRNRRHHLTTILNNRRPHDARATYIQIHRPIRFTTPRGNAVLTMPHRGKARLYGLFLNMLNRVRFGTRNTNRYYHRPYLRHKSITNTIIKRNKGIYTRRATKMRRTNTVLSSRATPNVNIVTAPGLKTMVRRATIRPYPATHAIFRRRIKMFLNRTTLRFMRPRRVPIMRLTLPLNK